MKAADSIIQPGPSSPELIIIPDLTIQPSEGFIDTIQRRAGEYPEISEDTQKHETIDNPTIATITNGGATLETRLEGGHITRLELEDPDSGQPVTIFNRVNEGVLRVFKQKTAGHVAVPMGKPSEIVEQHGFGRWAIWHQLFRKSAEESEDGVARAAYQAERPDTGESISRLIELSRSSVTETTSVRNPLPGFTRDPSLPSDSYLDLYEYEKNNTIETSIGTHPYLALPNGNVKDLKVDGKSLDELLGDGSEEAVLDEETLFYDISDKKNKNIGETIVDFPDGRRIKITARYEGDVKPDYPVALWIWKRKDTDTICFEAMVGVDKDDNNDGISLAPGQVASLSVTYENMTRAAQD